MFKIRHRHALIDTGLRMCHLGLTKRVLTPGNLSVRIDKDSFLVTPSGSTPETLKPMDIVHMSIEGDRLDNGSYEPSVEWRFHRDLYAARPDVGAIIHVHAPFATTVACLEQDIPAFHYMVALAGGDSVRCAKYATFGTQELTDNMMKAMEGRHACLLSHHGMVVTGANIEDALQLAVEIETLAEQYLNLLKITKKPPLLSSKEMGTIVEKFKTYGQLVARPQDEDDA